VKHRILVRMGKPQQAAGDPLRPASVE